MKCREARRLISLLYDGRLDGPAKIELEGHLNDCSECRSEARLITSIAAPLESLVPLEPKDDGWERIKAELDSKKHKPASRVMLRLGFAMVVFCCLVAFFALRERPHRQLAYQPKHKAPVRSVRIEKHLHHSIIKDTPKSEPIVALKKLPVGKRVWVATRVAHHRRAHYRIARPLRQPKTEDPAPKVVVAQLSPDKHIDEPGSQPDVSVGACDLISQGFSVLIAASEAAKSDEGGGTL